MICMVLYGKRFCKVIALVVLCLFSLLPSVSAAEPIDPWKGADGSYTEEKSSQYSNKRLQIKFLENTGVLYSFDIMKGNEKEDKATQYNVTGFFRTDVEGLGSDSFLLNDGTIKLTFQKDGDKIIVTQSGTMTVSVDGTYLFVDKTLEVNKNMALSLLESLPPVKTSLNAANRPYDLEYDETQVNGKFVQVTATHEKSGTVFARFLVAEDLTTIYRQDSKKDKPILIFGEEKPADTAAKG